MSSLKLNTVIYCQIRSPSGTLANKAASVGDYFFLFLIK